MPGETEETRKRFSRPRTSSSSSSSSSSSNSQGNNQTGQNSNNQGGQHKLKTALEKLQSISSINASLRLYLSSSGQYLRAK